ncbi:potassium/proton antiporter regulatory subunit (CPA2 family) [Hydrogenivirga caldilitoris]|uniref:Potassium/proton antiporter regulatory subunit (CPA2 family) n=1 Tax=Hydrogenivirga caldilitoris TaxID=246264 RepID=A0A497XTX6_9AQUI|nr:cation:proton antiporter regulatory subunit [Hydrogenivirga caldilitoris]RLJ70582.1 potassium/proton antiporter regulatory subunit (CPA2 family) [Hydrogenivirga caldilitoris]
MRFRETDLPGVGKRYTLELEDGGELTLIIHNTGRRELYIIEQEEEEPTCVISLTEDEAKDLGFLLAGTTYQPVAPEKMELIMKEMVMEWVRVGEGSNLVNKTIAEAQIRKKTKASIVAIIRGEDMIVSPDPYDTVIKPGDTLVVVGTRQHINSFLEYCGECYT